MCIQKLIKIIIQFTTHMYVFSFFKRNLFSCGYYPQQIIAKARLQMIVSWPLGHPDIYCWPKGLANI